MTTLSDILEKFGLKKNSPAPAAEKQKAAGPAPSQAPAAQPKPAVPHAKTPGHAPTTPPPAASAAGARPAQAAPVQHDAGQKQKSAGTGQPKQAHTPPAASQAEARSVAPSAPQTAAPPPPPAVKAEPSVTPAAGAPVEPAAPAEPAATPSAPAAESEPEAISVVDVVSDLENRAARHPEKLNWKVSIVDLLKLLGLESSFDARKGLAVELGCPADLMNDSAKMNTWLHKAVLSRIAENGGNIPKELID